MALPNRFEFNRPPKRVYVCSVIVEPTCLGIMLCTPSYTDIASGKVYYFSRFNPDATTWERPPSVGSTSGGDAMLGHRNPVPSVKVYTVAVDLYRKVSCAIHCDSSTPNNSMILSSRLSHLTTEPPSGHWSRAAGYSRRRRGGSGGHGRSFRPRCHIR